MLIPQGRIVLHSTQRPFQETLLRRKNSHTTFQYALGERDSKFYSNLLSLATGDIPFIGKMVDYGEKIGFSFTPSTEQIANKNIWLMGSYFYIRWGLDYEGFVPHDNTIFERKYEKQ